jgi:E3 SUMO-protein ligase NSE2
MEKCSQLEYDFSKETLAVSGIQCETIEEFDRVSQQLLQEVVQSRPDPKGSQRYMKFAKDLEDLQYVAKDIEAPAQSGSSVAVGGDDDLMVQDDDTHVHIDPISKNPIKDPVRNVICKHVYDKATIEESIKLNNRLR